MIRFSLLCIAFVVAASASEGAGQEAGASGTAPLDALRRCATIAADSERLLCYDAQAKTFLDATDRGEIKIVDREEAERTRKGLFGFSGVKVPFFEDGAQVEEIESTITSVRGVGRDGWHITIADGDAVWEITNPPMRFNAPRVGDKVVIKRGSLTSYFIRVRTQLGVKGRRIQ